MPWESVPSWELVSAVTATRLEGLGWVTTTAVALSLLSRVEHDKHTGFNLKLWIPVHPLAQALMFNALASDPYPSH